LTFKQPNDDFSYYLNDVYGAYKDVVFYVAIVRPRRLKYPL